MYRHTWDQRKPRQLWIFMLEVNMLFWYDLNNLTTNGYLLGFCAFCLPLEKKIHVHNLVFFQFPSFNDNWKTCLLAYVLYFLDMPTIAKQCRWLVQMEPNWVMNFACIHLNSHGLKLRGRTTFLPKAYFGLLSGSYIEMIKILETHCVPNLSKFITH